MTLGRFLSITGIVAGLFVTAPVAGANIPTAGRQVYVTNILSNDVSTFDTRADGGLARRDGLTTAGGNPRTIVVTPDGRHAYTSNGGNPDPEGEDFNSISMYRITTDGQLVSLGEPVETNEDPDALAVAPNGRTLYVVSRGAGTLQIFTIGTDGLLEEVGDPIPTGAASPRGVAMTPDGRFLFVSHGNPLAHDQDFLTRFTVDDYDGTLAPLGKPVPIGSAGGAMAVTPDGRFLYVPCSASRQIFGFEIKPDGELVQVPGPTAEAPDVPIAAAATPDGRHLYVADGGLVSSTSQRVSAYRIGDDGALEHLANVTTSGVAPVALTPTPDGRNLYVSNLRSWDVSAFTIGTEGQLSEIAGSPYPTGGIQPAYQSIVVRPNQGPVAAFSFRSAAAGYPTTFDAAASTDPDGRIARYDWDFGDGTVLRDGGPTPTHVYRNAGTFKARLTVTDNENCSTVFVYNGTSALCTGSAAASTVRSVVVAR